VSLCALNKPHVALVDISMPDDGIAAVNQIAVMKLDTRIIMLTVSENEDDVLRALNAGAGGYVLKGVSGPELIGAVKVVAAGDTFVSPNLAVRRHDKPAADKKRLVDVLSAQETRTLQFVAMGMNNRECADQFGVGEQTVNTTCLI
jgi:two-component system, NarL family, nitrate/nitrite response regulator NarL